MLDETKNDSEMQALFEGLTVSKSSAQPTEKVMVKFCNTDSEQQSMLSELADLTFLIEGKEVKVHRSLFADKSHFFRKLFEDYKDQKVFELTCCNLKTFQIVSNFIYEVDE